MSNLFDARRSPWAEIGNDISKVGNFDEAIREGGLDWEVIQKPIYVQSDLQIIDGRQRTTFRQLEGVRANLRSDNDFFLGNVSDTYDVVQNRQGFLGLEDLIGSKEVFYETAGVLRGGRQVWMMARMPETTIVGDKVMPFITFTNSHDGKGSTIIFMTPIRIICQNTLNFALANTPRKWSAIHVGDFDKKLEVAKSTLQLANDYMVALAENADILAQKAMNDKQINNVVVQLFPLAEDATDRVKVNVEATREEVIARIKNAPDLKHFQGTAYSVIQGVSDFVNHSAPRRVTQTYQENLFSKVIAGHPVIDKAHELLMKVA